MSWQNVVFFLCFFFRGENQTLDCPSHETRSGFHLIEKNVYIFTLDDDMFIYSSACFNIPLSI